ncbi:conserved domain protein [Peptoniphilus sp. oral taxon 375 str. F0436]|nr:conserved domain protein [Peptoniphilus sp. oral taxon 375 str. F0436]
MLSRGGEFSGYMASLYIKNNEDISSFKYLMEPQYISPEILENEHNSEIIEDAKISRRWITDENNGTVYTFVLDDKK